MSLFTGPDKSRQVETFLCLCQSPPPTSRPALTPFWNQIGEVESCTTILHNSILLLLEALLPGNQMFFHCTFILAFFCVPHTPTLRTHSSIPGIASLKCIQDLPWIIIRPIIPPIFSFFWLPSICRGDYHGLHSIHFLPVFQASASFFIFFSPFPLSWSTPQAIDHQACPTSHACWSTGLSAVANQREWWIGAAR